MTRDLAGVCATPQLPCDLGELGGAGAAEGVSAGEQASAGVDRLGAVAGGMARRGELGALAAGCEAKCLARDDLADREGVVDLEYIDLRWGAARLRVGLLRGAGDARVAPDLGTAVIPECA